MRPTLAMSSKWTALALLPLVAVLFANTAVAKQKKSKHSESGAADATEAAPATLSPTETHDAPPASGSEAPRGQTPEAQASSSATGGAPAQVSANEAPPSHSAGGAMATATPASAESDANAPPAAAATEPEPSNTPPPAGHGIPVEELPGSAFLRPRVPGLFGGSLWLEPSAWATQWPYVPRTGIGISGSAWVDTGYEQIKSDSLTHADTVYQLQQGRVQVRVTPTYSDGHFFVQGQAELVANKDQSVSQSSNQVVDTDDLWVRVGHWNVWDLQLGRYQGWEIYHLGMGLDLNTLERHGATDAMFSDPVDFYGVTYGYYRSSGVGNIGLHVFPTEYLRFELLGHAGFENGLNTIGGRPTAVLDILGGVVRVKVGGEYRTGHDLHTTSDPMTGAKIDGLQKLVQRGYGASIQVILDRAVEFGANAGAAIVDHTGATGSPDPTGSFNVKSAGGFANFSIGGIFRQPGLKDLLLGLGGNYTFKDDLQLPLATHTTNTQAFAAVQYLVGGQLWVKLVGAYDKGTWLHVQNDMGPAVTNKMLSARLRVMYLF